MVLIGPAHPGDWWYRKARFGIGFTEHLLANYAYRGVVGAHAIYVPQCGVPERDRVAFSEPAGEPETVLTRGGKPNALKTTLTHWLQGKMSWPGEHDDRRTLRCRGQLRAYDFVVMVASDCVVKKH